MQEFVLSRMIDGVGLQCGPGLGGCWSGSPHCVCCWWGGSSSRAPKHPHPLVVALVHAGITIAMGILGVGSQWEPGVDAPALGAHLPLVGPVGGPGAQGGGQP